MKSTLRRRFFVPVLAALLVAISGQHVCAATVSFSTTGGPYTFTVPAGVTAIRARAVGGGGGNYLGAVVTRGADVSATLPVSPGDTLYIYVAGNGGSGTAAGFNGGGAGGGALGTGSGGGASDIRTVSGDLNARILVAGGGGGSMIFHAGGDAGQAGLADPAYGPAGPGTATNGGAAGVGFSTPATPGTFGSGGTGGVFSGSNAFGGGGGGGWYGGGGGSEYGGGGGGSSYVVPGATDVTNALSDLPPAPFVSITYATPPTAPIVLDRSTFLTNGSLQLTFTNEPGASFTIRASTNLNLPLTNWATLGAPVENPAGHYQFDHAGATNLPLRFYGVSSP